MRLFSRIDLKGEEAQIRITQDVQYKLNFLKICATYIKKYIYFSQGLSVLLPYIRKRIVSVPQEEMIKILTTTRTNYQFTDLCEETRKLCESWSKNYIEIQ